MMDKAVFDARYNLAPQAFHNWMKDKLDFKKSTLLDFGTDTGVMALGLAQHCQAKRVIGVDINDNYKNLLNEIRGRLELVALPANLSFKQIRPDEPLSKTFADETIDCVFSWSVFEHISQPFLPLVASEIAQVLRPGGYAFIQIAPLYYSAFGSHMDMIVPEPWAHLTMQLDLFQSRILHAEKNEFYISETDANFEEIKRSLWGVFLTLNRIVASELLDLFEDTELNLVREYRTVNSHIPPANLTAIYNKDVLTTEQIVYLFQKN